MKIMEFIKSNDGHITKYNIDANKLLIKTGIIGVLLYGTLSGDTVYASSISEGLQPLIDVLKDLAEPVAYGFMIKGFIQIMSGEEQRGMKFLKGAITGYIGIQWRYIKLLKSINNIKNFNKICLLVNLYFYKPTLIGLNP